MASSPPRLSDEMVAAIRAGHERFEALHQAQLCPEDAAARRRVSIADGIRSYASVTETLVDGDDNDVKVLWSLTTMVLDIQAQGIRAVNASLEFKQWYNAHFFDPEAAREIIEAFQQVPVDEPRDSVERLFLHVYEYALKMFAFGQFVLVAEVIGTALERLRQTPWVVQATYLDEGAERSLADVLRLLQFGFSAAVHDDQQWRQWKEAANRAVYDARVDLWKDTEDRDPQHPATLLKRLALSLCTAMSGDARCILEASDMLQGNINALDYLCAVCSITMPFELLADVGRLAQEIDDDRAILVHHYYFSQIRFLLGQTTVDGVLLAMEALYSLTADADFRSQSQLSIPTHLPEDHTQAILARRVFAIRFMAAHVADLCSPALVGDAATVPQTFARNRVVERYLRDYFVTSEVLPCGLRYCALSPLMNPRVVSDLLHRCMNSCVRDRRYLAVVEGVVATSLSEASALQQVQYELCTRRLAGSKVVREWFGAFFAIARKRLDDVLEQCVRDDVDHQRLVPAIRTASAIRRFYHVEAALRRLTDAPRFMALPAVLELGEAVYGGRVELLPTAAPRGVQHTLRACAIAFDADMFRRSDRRDPQRSLLRDRLLQSCDRFCREPSPPVALAPYALVAVAESFTAAIVALCVDAKATPTSCSSQASADLLACCMAYIASLRNLKHSDLAPRLDVLTQAVVLCFQGEARL